MEESHSKLTKSGRPKVAFLLDEDKLQRLTDILKQKAGAAHKPEYTVLLSDDSSLNTSSLEEVLDVPNTKSRSITSIVVSTPLTSPLHYDLKFANVEDPPVTYEVTGPEDDVRTLAAKLDEFVDGLRQWYSPIVFTNPWIITLLLIIPIMVVVIAIAPQVGAVTAAIVPGNEDSAVSFSVWYAVSYVLFFVLGASPLWLILFLRKRIFPSGVFAIGGGISRHERARRTYIWIGGAIGTVITTTLGAIVVSFVVG